MNYVRLVAAAIAAAVLFFTYGFLVHGMLIAKDYLPYPEGVYRRVNRLRATWHLDWPASSWLFWYSR